MDKRLQNIIQEKFNFTGKKSIKEKIPGDGVVNPPIMNKLELEKPIKSFLEKTISLDGDYYIYKNNNNKIDIIHLSDKDDLPVDRLFKQNFKFIKFNKKQDAILWINKNIKTDMIEKEIILHSWESDFLK